MRRGMRGCLMGGKGISAIVAAAVVLGAVGAVAGAVLLSEGSARSGNADRFASLTFGAGGAAALAVASAGPRTALSADGDDDPPALPETPVSLTEYRTPNGWLLRPAGKQVDADRAPTGVGLSPDGKTAIVVSSGTAKEAMTVVDTATMASTQFLTSDLYMGAAIDANGNAWVSTGGRNRVMQFRLAGPVAVPLRPTVAFPGSPNNAIPVKGYPGAMRLIGSKLYVAGNLSVPQASIGGPTCPAGSRPLAAPICSVINVIDVSDPFAPNPAVGYITVGRDAFGIAYNAAAGKLYVTNWADETNPARTTGNAATATGTVSVVDLSTGLEESHLAVGRHPTGIALSPDNSTLYVANSADDSITKILVGGDGSLGTATTIDVRTTPDAPKGAAPIALAFTPDGSHLLVGLAGQNAVEVREPDGDGITQTIGSLTVPHTYIPTGWYPSAIVTGPNPSGTGSRVYVTNIKGIGAGPGLNAYFPPGNGARTQGTLQAVDFDPAMFDEWTETVVENNGWAPIFDTATEDAAEDPCSPAPLPGGGTAFSQLLCDGSQTDGAASPYHVVYIVKENKTFDQYFGDINAFGLTDAEASPSFLLYGQPVTTNQHNLAKLFTLSDRFWADSEASTTGHSWTSAGYANEYIEITWNPEYSEGLRGSRGSGQYANQEPSGFSRGGAPPGNPDVRNAERELFEPEERLVDRFVGTGLSFRVYSDDVNDDSAAISERFPLGLWGLNSSAVNRGRDLDFPDTDRAEIFLTGHTVSHTWSLDQGGPPPSYREEIGLCDAPNDPDVEDAPNSFCGRPGAAAGEYAKFSLAAWAADPACQVPNAADDAACQAKMPNFIYMALPVDHTLGFNPGNPTPASMVADNDYATGQIVDALSKSPFWKNTLILITEDDTQLAGDHVDAHRTFLLAAGGLAQRRGPSGAASHQPGSFPSILKTVETLFGLEPLTVYDRGAVPLHDLVVSCAPGVTGCGTDDRNTVTYDAEKPPTPFTRNEPTGIAAQLSLLVDWRLDRGDPDLVTALFYYVERGRPLPERYRRLVGR